MIISVVAANGRSGKAFVLKALEAGHKVRAGVHSRDLDIKHPNLEVIKGDATNLDYINKLIAGSNAVACFIGHTRKSAPDVQTITIKNILTEMQRQNIKRLVSLTGTGARFDLDKIGFIDKIMNTSIKLVDPKRIQDGIDHVDAIKASHVDWTIIRVLKLTNAKAKPFKLSEQGPAKVFVSRSEVAEAFLNVIEHGSFIGQAPIISNS